MPHIFSFSHGINGDTPEQRLRNHLAIQHFEEEPNITGVLEIGTNFPEYLRDLSYLEVTFWGGNYPSYLTVVSVYEKYGPIVITNLKMVYYFGYRNQYEILYGYRQPKRFHKNQHTKIAYWPGCSAF